MFFLFGFYQVLIYTPSIIASQEKFYIYTLPYY